MYQLYNEADNYVNYLLWVKGFKLRKIISLFRDNTNNAEVKNTQMKSGFCQICVVFNVVFVESYKKMKSYLFFGLTTLIFTVYVI